MPSLTTLDWLEAELAPLYTPADTTGVTFSVAVWCGAEEDRFEDDDGPFGWVEVAGRVPQWQLRGVLRHLLARGWSSASVCVDREG
jgi:hypothetical protein